MLTRVRRRTRRPKVAALNLFARRAVERQARLLNYLFCFDVKSLPATRGAYDIRLSAQPTDIALELETALRAANLNFKLVEILVQHLLRPRFSADHAGVENNTQSTSSQGSTSR